MPPVYERRFRVRQYECDAYGHMNNSNYLRFMQETAMDASAAVGYPGQRYEQLGTTWLIRHTEIEYLQALHYQDEVVVRTWVADFHRVRSQRMYEFRLAGELIARASSDWIYLDVSSGLPVSIPEDMAFAFLPEGMNGKPARRNFFSALHEPQNAAYIDRRRVEWRDLDAVQHVNNAVYLNYLEEAGIQVAQAYGWPLERMRQDGFGILARRHKIDYRRPAFLGDNLEIATWVTDMGRSSATRHFVIRRAGEPEALVQASSLFVWVDLHSGRLVRIPDRLRNDFAGNILTKPQQSARSKGG